MKTIEPQRIVDDAARETLGNTLAKRATFATTKAAGNRAKNHPICPSNPPGRSTNRVNAAMPVNTKAMIPVLPIRKSHCDSLHSEAFGAGQQEPLRITVGNRGYHYLSQSEIDGGKRIYRHLSNFLPGST